VIQLSRSICASGLFWSICLLTLSACGQPQPLPDVPAVATDANPSCNLPDQIQVEPETRSPGEANRDGQIDYYVFALSWQPQWCEQHGNEPDQLVACRMNQFGFRVHGLWPSSERGQSPRYCRDAPALDARLVRSNLCMMPSAYLQQHEWAAHGTCGWTSGQQYFAAVSRVWNGYREPDLSQVTTAGDLRQALMKANPSWSADALDVRVARGNWLTEVRVCLDLDFKPRPCPGHRTGTPDGVRLRIASRS
jgi:ribonuclease T2